MLSSRLMFTYLCMQVFSAIMPCASTCSSIFHVSLGLPITPQSLHLSPELQLSILEESYLLSALDDGASSCCLRASCLAGGINSCFWSRLSVQHCRASHFWEEVGVIQRGGERVGGMRAGPVSADSSFSSAVPDRGHRAGGRARLRQELGQHHHFFFLSAGCYDLVSFPLGSSPHLCLLSLFALHVPLCFSLPLISISCSYKTSTDLRVILVMCSG